MKKLAIILAVATSVIASQKIDIYKYDIIDIYKNLPTFIADLELDNIKMSNKGINPYKILKGKALSCKKLGFDKKPTKQVFPDHIYYRYTKELKNSVVATCTESIYRNGSINFSVLIDGNN